MQRENNHAEQALAYRAGWRGKINRRKPDWMPLDYYGFINHLSD